MTTLRPEDLLADALRLEPSKIGKEIGIDTCESWDSLAHFRVVAAIEEALKRPLSAEEIYSATDYCTVAQLLSDAPPIK